MNAKSRGIRSAIRTLAAESSHGIAPRAAGDRPRSALLVWCMLAAVSALVWWSSRTQLDIVVRSQGPLIPDSSTQTIQSLEGGIVTEIFVREGDLVEKGALLVKLHDAQYRARNEENAANRRALETRVVRLLAEANGKLLEFPETLLKECAEQSEKEQLIFDRRRRDEDTRAAGLQQQIEQRQKRLRLLMRSFDDGSLPLVDRLDLEEQIADLGSRLASAATAFAREAAESYDVERAKLDALNESMKADLDRIARCEIRSPVRGVINSIRARAPGRVIASGEAIMEIVPEGDRLVIEARVRPEDVGFIHAGMQAQVRFTAFDFATYGGLSGDVETMGADTIHDSSGNAWYPVRVRTEEDTLGYDRRTGQPLRLRPGMVAEVAIVAGRRSVLDYLVKPITRGASVALRER